MSSAIMQSLTIITFIVFNRTIQPWVTNEVLDLCDQRRQLKQQQYTSAEARLQYKNNKNKKVSRSQEEDEGSEGRVD